MRKKWTNIFVLSLFTICSNAQTAGYKFYSKVDSVKKNGFYNIEIRPEITAHLKTDYSDLRIINDSGKWIPHILHFPASERSGLSLIMESKFSIAENSGTNTGIIIESGQNISSNFGLIITNTAAKRFCTLSGTNDKKTWFVINDSILITPVPAKNATENTFQINFPPNNYRFYRIVIHNNNKDPFNIKGVVEYTSGAKITNILSKQIINPGPVVEQKDSGRVSYIKISQQQPFHFDNISLQLSGVKYFYRNVSLYVPYSENHSFSNPGRLLESFSISNNSTLQFHVPLTKASVFYLIINNEDNLPLTVKQVNTSFSERFITAYLENVAGYRLIMDNAAAVLPNYDLSKLNAPVPDSVPLLLFNKIIPTEEVKPPVVPQKNNNWVLWVAVCAALLILLFFTYKMLKEVDKKNTP